MTIRDDVVADVAEAVTLNQDVQWDRCARLATPASRRLLDGLRVVARVREAFHAPADASPGSLAATTTEPSAGVFVRRAAYTIVAVAAVEVAAALVLLPWAWDDYHREYGDLVVYLAGLLIGNVASVCVLLLAMRRDRRTGMLAAHFLMNASLVQPSVMLALLWGIPPQELFGYPHVYPFVFAPAFLWAFRPRVSPSASPNAAGRPCPSHGFGQRGGRVRALGRAGSVTGTGAGGLGGAGAVLGGLRRVARRPGPVGIGGGGGRRAARTHRSR